MGLLKYAPYLMIYVNSETILNNDRFFSPYMRRVIHIIEKNHLTITYVNDKKTSPLILPFQPGKIKEDELSRVTTSVHLLPHGRKPYRVSHQHPPL